MIGSLIATAGLLNSVEIIGLSISVISNYNTLNKAADYTYNVNVLFLVVACLTFLLSLLAILYPESHMASVLMTLLAFLLIILNVTAAVVANGVFTNQTMGFIICYIMIFLLFCMTMWGALGTALPAK